MQLTYKKNSYLKSLIFTTALIFCAWGNLQAQEIEVGSATAFAVALNPDGTLNEGTTDCFINKGNGKSKRWGWSNGEFSADGTSQDYVFDLIAGAGRCQLDSGTDAGEVYMNIAADGAVMVAYVVKDYSNDPDYDVYSILREVHLYIGCDYTPGKLAPGQYPFKPTTIYDDNNDRWIAMVTIDASDPALACGGGGFYMIAHAELENMPKLLACPCWNTFTEEELVTALNSEEVTDPQCYVQTGIDLVTAGDNGGDGLPFFDAAFIPGSPDDAPWLGCILQLSTGENNVFQSLSEEDAASCYSEALAVTGQISWCPTD